MFFAVQGDKVVLLLGGYDKGMDPTCRRQEREIDMARARLRLHIARQKADAKRARRTNDNPRIGVTEELPPEKRVPASRSFLAWSRRRRRRKP
ncbi:MAG TPA: hypothetical protein VH231_15365 [Solirubrobacteraceae bacterium]|nr:hypothetical protein [Solirubrobacteraceae bacterium]